MLGGGGYVAGPAGLAALSLRPAAGADRGRPPPRPRQPAARPARAPRLPRVPDRGPRGRALPGHRPAGAGGGRSRADRDAARERFGIAAGDRCLLVFGGSQGARSINLCALEAFAGADAAARDFHVLHITGSRDYDGGRERARRGAATPTRYTLLDYEPDLADALAACDLVLARAGGSIFEIAAAGRPAILVPYPHATGRHQHANAALDGRRPARRS